MIRDLWREYWWVSLTWFSVGFLCGSMNSAAQRDLGKTGCVYKSIAPLINPGFVLGCEIFRKHFEIEGFHI